MPAPRTPLLQRAIANHACAYCGAERDQPCRDSVGPLQAVHGSRVAAASAMADPPVRRAG